MEVLVTKAGRRPRKSRQCDAVVEATPDNSAQRRQPTEDEIRFLAYCKWLGAGAPPGDGVEFWFAAENELQMTNGIGLHVSPTESAAT
jgi:hypothetical protein